MNEQPRQKNMANELAKEIDMYVKGLDIPRELLDSLKRIDTEMSGKRTQSAIDDLNIEFLEAVIGEIKEKGLISGVHCMAGNYEDYSKDS